MAQGLNHVLMKKQSFILELFTNPDPASASPAVLPEAQRLSLMRNQEESPPLNIFYYSQRKLA